MADVAGIKAAAISMNAGDSYALFAGMLTNRPWEKVRPLFLSEANRKYTFYCSK